MKKKPATSAEKKHLARVASIGCIVCRNMGHWDTPAEIHHLMAGTGAGQRSPHCRVLPLCFHHHSAQGVDGIHGGQMTWEKTHGPELELLAQLCELLGINQGDLAK